MSVAGWTPVETPKSAPEGWTPVSQQGMGAAALGKPEDISTGPEGTTPTERLMSPESQREATKGGLVAASMAPLMAIPASWPLIGKVAATAATGAAVGAAQSAVDEHPSGRDILKNMGTQAAAYGGAELAGGLLGKAFQFWRTLRGVSAAAKAAGEEAAATPAITPAPQTTPVATPKPAGDVMAETLGIFDKDPQSLITSALKPGTNNVKWASDMAKAFPDLKAAEAELGRPIKTFADAKEAATVAKAHIWDQYAQKLSQARAMDVGPLQTRNPTTGQLQAVTHEPTINGNEVADAMMNSIDARTAIQNPGLVERITKIADTYRRPMKLDEAEEFLQSANNELNSYYAKNKVGQQVAARDPETGHVVAEANQLRASLYAKLDELTGPGAAQLKQRYGALSNFQDVLSKRENVALRQQPQSLAEQLSKARAYAKIAVGVARGDPWAVYEGTQQSAAATWLKERQTSEAMMERAFANFGRPSGGTAVQVPSGRVQTAAPVAGAVAGGASSQQ